MPEWKFSDPPNVGVFAESAIFNDGEWIAYASHDAEDGAWQFHTSLPATAEPQVMLVCLKDILNVDPSIAALADLPPGWRAWRETRDSAWQREPRPLPH